MIFAVETPTKFVAAAGPGGDVLEMERPADNCGVHTAAAAVVMLAEKKRGCTMSAVGADGWVVLTGEKDNDHGGTMAGGMLGRSAKSGEEGAGKSAGGIE